MSYKLADICLKITDGSHNPPGGVDKSEYLMLSSKNVYDDCITFDEARFLSKSDFEIENKRTDIKPGDVLLTIVGTVGRAAVVHDNVGNIALQRSVAVLKPNHKKCCSRYLMYALIANRRFFEGEARGVAQKGIYLKQLEKTEVELPRISVQIQIVELLDKVQSTISARKQQLSELDNLVKARFVEMFGDPIQNTKGWKTEKLSMICSAIYGGGTPSKSHPEYFEGDIPWVSPKDMKSMVITDSIDHITAEAVDNSSTKMVPAGAVLIVIRSGILKHSLPVALAAVDLTVNQDMKAFITGDKLSSEFLVFYFKAIESDILSGVRGVTADNIDFKEFQNRMVIVPPMQLQNQFADFVAQVDKSKLSVQKSLDQLETLKKALMQQYFE